MAKPRKGAFDSLTGLYKGARDFVTGKDWALQNEIDETKEKTRARACFRECRSCGACANSARDSTYPYQYDANAMKLVNCNSCEKFRFHDCHNGWMRNARQEAEPFSDEAQKLFDSGGKPLI